MPTISVIIPVYNVGEYLSDCIESVLNQTFKDIEIICIDDGSTDESHIILEQFQAKDSRIHLIKKSNEGQGRARNIAISMARGEFIAFVDGDDIIDRYMLDRLVSKANSTRADIVISEYYHFSDNSHVSRFQDIVELPIPETYDNRVVSWKDIPNFIFKFQSISGNKLYRKQFLLNNNIKFIEYKIYEDDLFCIKCLLLARKIAFLREAFYGYRRLRNGQTTGRTDRAIEVFFTSYLLENFIQQNDSWITLKNQFQEKLLRKLSLCYHGRTSSSIEETFYKNFSLLLNASQIHEMLFNSHISFKNKIQYLLIRYFKHNTYTAILTAWRKIRSLPPNLNLSNSITQGN